MPICKPTSLRNLFCSRGPRLFSASAHRGEMSIRDPNPEDISGKVLLGVHPCDAAAIGALKALFLADTPDPRFSRRLDRLTVIGLSCGRADVDCFCASMGGGPGDPKGSDILLTRLVDGDFLAEILSEKGEEIVLMAPGLFRPASAEVKESCLANVGSPLFSPENSPPGSRPSSNGRISGPGSRSAASAAESAPSSARHAPVSISRTRGGGNRASGCAAGIRAAFRCLPSTRRATIPANSRVSAGASG